MNAELSPSDLTLFQSLLLEEIGIHYEHEQRGLLGIRLAERMSVHGLHSVNDYFALIRSPRDGSDELRTLIDSVTVGETYFFRNQPQFDALTQRLLPPLIAERLNGERRLTIWSAGCSTGEEPYSLAITLLETLPQPASWRISLLATDVNRVHIQKAREAIYGERAVRKVPDAWLAKHFHNRNGAYILRDEVKRLVRFEPHNLVKDPYALPGMTQVDFLFCRNVIIYFPAAVIRRLMDQLAFCMGPAGWLFLGDAETLWQISDRFSPVEFPHAFLYRPATRAAIAPAVAPPARTRPAPPSAPVELKGESAAARSCELGLKAFRAKDHARALTHFEDALRAHPRHVRSLVGKATLLADRDLREEAIAHLLQAVRSDNLCSEAYYLLGVLYANADRHDEAIASLQQAVYVDPSLALAYFTLANVFRAQGQQAKARKQFENALRALEGCGEHELARHSEELTCGYVREACRRNLQRLSSETAPR